MKKVNDMSLFSIMFKKELNEIRTTEKLIRGKADNNDLTMDELSIAIKRINSIKKTILSNINSRN